MERKKSPNPGIVRLKCDQFNFDPWLRLRIFPKKEDNMSCVHLVKKFWACSTPLFKALDENEELQRLLDQLKSQCASQKTQRMTEQLMRQTCTTTWPTSKLILLQILRKWVLSVIPKPLLGGMKNVSRFAQNLKVLLSRGKKGVVTVDMFIRGLTTEAVPWLSKDDNVDLFKLVVHFIVERVIWRLLRSFFFITDTSWGKKEIFFIFKKHYQSIYQKAFHSMERRGETKSLKLLTSANKVAKVTSIKDAPATIKGRIMPKLRGFRLIGCPGKAKQTPRLITADARKTLSFIDANFFPESVDLHGKKLHKIWNEFKLAVGSEKIFFAKMDVKNAFDSVDLDLLSSIIKHFKDKLPTRLHEIKTVFLRQRSSKLESHTYTRITDNAQFQADPPSSDFFQGSRQRSLVEAKAALKQVSRRVRLHTLRFGIGRKQFTFIKTKGLIQGEPLSSGLCNLYYGFLVSRELWPRMATRFDPNAVRFLVRAVDDFLFMSTSRSEVLRFQELMVRGFEKYNFFVRPDKTLTNCNDEEVNEVHFCGILLNVVNGQVRPDFANFFGKSVAHSLTMNFISDPEDFVTRRMLFICVLKIDAIYLDSSINELNHIQANLFEIFYILGLKFKCLVESVCFSANVVRLESSLDILQQCLKRVMARIRQKKRHCFQPADLSMARIKWLYWNALWKVIPTMAQRLPRSCLKFVRRERSHNGNPEMQKLIDSILYDRKTVTIKASGFPKLK